MAAMFIYGPKGCGKTTYGKALAAFFGKCSVIDHDGRDLDEYWDSVLVLTSDDSIERAVPFEMAMFEAGFDPSLLKAGDQVTVCEKNKPDFETVTLSDPFGARNGRRIFVKGIHMAQPLHRVRKTVGHQSDGAA